MTPTPESLAAERRAQILDMSPVEFSMWLNNPVTRAVMQFLDDQIARQRETVADIVEAGPLGVGVDNALRDLGVLRGQLMAVRELRRIDLAVMQGFYAEQEAEPETGLESESED